ncbi:alpha/beta fold hydrolase [Streptosporangium canum]|uniref:alpha/beta fold hydrolase n=1 Tax=Streptosporangium canum TaxID=324952 RepID=UPI00343EF0DB
MNTPQAWTPVRWAAHADVRLAFDRLAGNDQGEPLLLITGLGVSRLWWPQGLSEAFGAGGFTVARYDQRDAGQSTRLPDTAAARSPIAALFGRRGAAYTAEEMTDDAIAVLDALGWESAHLFGVSLGGAIAQRIAIRHPGRVRTLTTMSAVPGDAAGLEAIRYVRLSTLVKLSRLKFPDTAEGDIESGVAVARLISSPGYPFDERSSREAITRIADAGVRDARSQSRQIGAQWHGPPISMIKAPTLVLHGEGDPLIRPSAARRIAGRVPGARLRILPGVGHELPEPVWDTIVDEVLGLRS